MKFKKPLLITAGIVIGIGIVMSVNAFTIQSNVLNAVATFQQFFVTTNGFAPSGSNEIVSLNSGGKVIFHNASSTVRFQGIDASGTGVVLATDSQGNLTTKIITGGSAQVSGSQWISSGTTIFYMSGNVGIGTTGISERLTISGNIGFAQGSNPIISVLGSAGGDLRLRGGAGASTQWGEIILSGGTSNGGNVSINGGQTANEGGTVFIKGGNAGNTGGDINIQPGFASSHGRVLIAPALIGNVGIGISNPTAKLHVVGDTMLSGNTTIGNATTLLATGGNVGIGTSNPTAKLHVIGSSIINIGGSVFNIFDGSNGRLLIDSNSSVLRARSPTNGAGITVFNGDSSIGGNIDISAGLQTAGNGRGGNVNVSAGQAALGGGNAQGGNVNISAGQAVGGGPTIFSGGNVNISTGSANAGGGGINRGGSIYLLPGTGTASDGRVGIGTTIPDQMLSVNGNASKAGGGSWATFSDKRLKDIGLNFTRGIKELLSIDPVFYNYKKDNGAGINDHEQHVGVIAQEIQKVIPEAVSVTDKGWLQVNNDPIIWTMLNAIKEQQVHIQKLEQRIELLEKK